MGEWKDVQLALCCAVRCVRSPSPRFTPTLNCSSESHCATDSSILICCNVSIVDFITCRYNIWFALSYYWLYLLCSSNYPNGTTWVHSNSVVVLRRVVPYSDEWYVHRVYCCTLTTFKPSKSRTVFDFDSACTERINVVPIATLHFFLCHTSHTTSLIHPTSHIPLSLLSSTYLFSSLPLLTLNTSGLLNYLN